MPGPNNPWGIRFMAIFHMANDSHLFRTAPGEGLLPLYGGNKGQTTISKHGSSLGGCFRSIRAELGSYLLQCGELSKVVKAGIAIKGITSKTVTRRSGNRPLYGGGADRRCL